MITSIDSMITVIDKNNKMIISYRQEQEQEHKSKNKNNIIIVKNKNNIIISYS